MSSIPQEPGMLAANYLEVLRSSEIDSPPWMDAVTALKKLGFHIVPTLIRAWSDGDPSLRSGVSAALREIGSLALYDVIEALNHCDPTIRRQATLFLYGTAGQGGVLIADIVPGLAKALQDPESTVRLRAAQTLQRLGVRARDAVPALMTAIRHSDGYVREWAASALGAVGPDASAAIPILTEALLDEDECVREEASRALNRIRL